MSDTKTLIDLSGLSHFKDKLDDEYIAQPETAGTTGQVLKLDASGKPVWGAGGSGGGGDNSANFDTYEEFQEAYDRGDVPEGTIVYIKEDSSGSGGSGGGGGTYVVANPTDEATDVLTKITIGETIYDVGGSNYMEFNTREEYNTANAAGNVPTGTVVYIKDGKFNVPFVEFETYTQYSTAHAAGSIPSGTVVYIYEENGDASSQFIRFSTEAELNAAITAGTLPANMQVYVDGDSTSADPSLKKSDIASISDIAGGTTATGKIATAQDVYNINNSLNNRNKMCFNQKDVDDVSYTITTDGFYYLFMKRQANNGTDTISVSILKNNSAISRLVAGGGVALPCLVSCSAGDVITFKTNSTVALDSNNVFKDNIVMRLA